MFVKCWNKNNNVTLYVMYKQTMIMVDTSQRFVLVGHAQITITFSQRLVPFSCGKCNSMYKIVLFYL